MTLDDIVLRSRETTSRYHLDIARSWRLIGEANKQHSPLAYAAFEYRCCIERLCFELFYLIKDEHLNQEDLKVVERFSSLLKAIYVSQGGKRKLERRMIFNRILSQANRAPKSQWIPMFKIGILQKYWHNLSEYCHRQLKPKATWKSLGAAWVSDGYAKLNEVETYLWPILMDSHIGWYSEIETAEAEVLQAWNEFRDGTIEERSLETRLTLMAPVLENRFRFKNLKN
jgi:hypothetical protein